MVNSLALLCWALSIMSGAFDLPEISGVAFIPSFGDCHYRLLHGLTEETHAKPQHSWPWGLIFEPRIFQ